VVLINYLEVDGIIEMEENIEDIDALEDPVIPEIDSKYRLIILAAKRSKQLQRGALPRVESDVQKHKPTRIALDEIRSGKVPFEFTEEV
jgi:DNA-directed RNA polymerase omega subunit